MPRRKLVPGDVVQASIPGLVRADKVARPPKLSESALQKQIIRTLGLLGYACEEIGSTRARVTCKNCGHNDWPTGWQGNSVGTPDLQVFRYVADFPPVGIRLEVKTATGAVRFGQAELASSGRSRIVRSVKEALEAVLAVEALLTDYKCSATQTERLERFLTENAGRI